MDTPILTLRRDLLRRTQNPDGGWGYFAGKQSWLEPTAYALMALHGDPQSAEASERAWKLVSGWQSSDGGWLPAGHLKESTWVTALGVSLCVMREEFGRSFDRGILWLMRAAGEETSFRNRLLTKLTGGGIGRDISNRGWPWRPGTNSWVEPTVHALLALKKAAPHFHDGALDRRIREGEQLLMTVRAVDGGWNYGSANALGVDLPSYPETTALAWLGLQNGLPAGIGLPEGRTASRLADAWVAIIRRIQGETAAAPPGEAPADLMIAALEAIGAEGGNARLFQTQGKAA